MVSNAVTSEPATIVIPRLDPGIFRENAASAGAVDPRIKSGDDDLLDKARS